MLKKCIIQKDNKVNLLEKSLEENLNFIGLNLKNVAYENIEFETEIKILMEVSEKLNEIRS